MAEPTENGILEYLESVRAPENAETFTEVQTGLGREGFRKYIPDPTQVADFLNFPKKEGLRTLAPAEREERFVGDLVSKFTDMFEAPFEQEISKRNDSQSIEDRMEADMARQELFKGQEISDIGDRSALGNFMGGGLEALLLDRYPEVADNPVFKTARFLAPQTLGEAAFEAATLFPPLFWMKPLKAGSQPYKQAKRLQDRIDKLQNTVTREKINATRGDGLAADYAATRAQNDIIKLRDDILEIVRKEDPAYAERLEFEARRRYIKAKRDADPMEKARRRMEKKRRMEEKAEQRRKRELEENLELDFSIFDREPSWFEKGGKYSDPEFMGPLEDYVTEAGWFPVRGVNVPKNWKGQTRSEFEAEIAKRKLLEPPKNKNALVDQKSTLNKTPESELMPEGFRTGEEILEDYNKNMDSIIDQVVKPKTPPETINTDEMSILEILERMKDMDLD